MAVTSSYEVSVIQAGDDASAHFKKAAQNANQNSYAAKNGILEGNRLLMPHNATVTEQAPVSIGHEIQTDGVGTKVRIYMQAFNALYEKFRAGEIDGVSETDLLETAQNLFYRMLLDLYAMNVDDFRHGDLALAVSDILDINHITLVGRDEKQGEIFCTAFAHAIGRIIEETGIALVAGETAILGDGDNLVRTRKNLGGVVGQVADSAAQVAGVMGMLDSLPHDVSRLIRDYQVIVESAIGAKLAQQQIDRAVELNLGGSTTGIRIGEKLEPMQDGDVVIALFEKKTKNGIISPRANGISAIRATMTTLLGDDWAMKTLADYFAAIKKKGGAIAPEVESRLADMGLDTPLWDIATGETTVFNPLIADKLLGGIHGKQEFGISGQIHVTGNPVGKWSDVVEGTDMSIKVSYENIQIPQIIEMCMIAEGKDFAYGMGKWNMGIPYALVCRADRAQDLIKKIAQEGYEAKVVGSVKQEDTPTIEVTYPDGKKIPKPIAEVRG